MSDARSKGKWQGMNWCCQSTRLAIYLRDGLACCYCGSSLEDGVILSLDHLKPHSKGGDNKPTNLVTCCKTCNSSRGNRPVRTFCKAVAEYVDQDASDIEKYVRAQSKKTLPREEANEMISRRGSVSKAVTELK